MNIALVAFDCDSKTIGGTSTFNTFLPKLFAPLGTVDFIFVSKKGKPPLPNKQAFTLENLAFTKVVKALDLAAVLNDYEWVYFVTPGWLIKANHRWAMENNFYHKLLKDLKVPFITGCYGEQDWNHYADAYPLFLTHSSFQGLIVFHKDFVHMSPLPVKKYAIVDNLINPEWLDEGYCGPKEKQVVCTSRWTASKNVDTLAYCAPSLNSLGLEVHFYGAIMGRNGYECEKYIRNTYPRGWTHHGLYQYDDIWNILRPALFHYNVKWRKRGVNIPFIELATIEAARMGCICIVSGPHVPSWFTECIKLNRDELKTLSLVHKIKKALENPPDTQKAWEQIKTNLSPQKILLAFSSLLK